MSQHRKRHDGTPTTASTIYVAKKSDQAARMEAVERNKREGRKHKKWSKAKIFVESIERDY